LRVPFSRILLKLVPQVPALAGCIASYVVNANIGAPDLPDLAKMQPALNQCLAAHIVREAAIAAAMFFTKTGTSGRQLPRHKRAISK
jgi:hypothetical protein